MSAYDILLSKLKAFIKKYYLNILMRGSIIFITLLAFIFLLIVFSESFGHFSVLVRTFFFYFFILTNILIFIRFILLPILKITKLAKPISFEKVAIIVSKFFPQIQDKLINTLELYKMNSNLKTPDELISAGIDQKISNISILNFNSAVKYRENIKYIKYLLAALLLFFSFYYFKPLELLNSTKRVINHAQHYEKPSPFKFMMLNDSLTIMKGDDFNAIIKIEGEYLPNEVYIDIDGNRFLMKANTKDKAIFNYSIKNINKDISISFIADEIKSNKFIVNVHPAPFVLKFSLSLDYPYYTGVTDKTVENIGDLVIPEGTKLSWHFYTDQTDSLFLKSGKNKYNLINSGSIFKFSKRISTDFNYSISLKNKYFSLNNVVDYKIVVKKDLFPNISFNVISDSSNFFHNYFTGNIEDDYGFSNLTFNYRVKKDNDKDNSVYKKIKLQFNPNLTKNEFFFYQDFSNYLDKDNNVVEYYFEVSDNDAINGSKTTKSSISYFKLPTKQEINEFKNEANKNIQSKIDLTMQLAQELKDDFKKLQENNLNNKLSDWENTQMLKNIAEKQSMLEQMLKNISLDNKLKNNMENTYDKKQQELLKKQAEIEKLMDELFTDEMKEMMKKINELQNKFDEKKFNKLLEKNENNYEQLAERLDRNKELLKRYEVEERLENTIKDLNELAEKQKELADKTSKRNSDKEQIKKEQEDIKKEFEQLEENYKETLQKNDELKTPMNLDDIDKETQDIKDEFKKTDESLSKKKKSDASKSQNKNSQNMKEMANKMQQKMDASSAKQNSEDINLMKKLLNSLLSFSFAQEDLFKEFRKVSYKNPKYITYSQNQIILKDNFSNINDSLLSLAKRQPIISSAVVKHLDIINSNLSESIKLMENRKINDAVKRQINIMSAANKLAILFSNIIQSMENMQSSGSGSGEGESSSKGSIKDMKGQQESLKKQMEQMLKKLEKGQNMDPNSMNKEFAQMLAQQEIFRQMMQEMKAKFNLSPETQKLLNEAEKLSKQNEKDMVNKRITPEMLNRQKLINSRLLEAENAENKRETENKRESKLGENKNYKSPEEFFDKYKNNKSFDENLYDNYNYKFKIFYKNLNNIYYDKIGE